MLFISSWRWFHWYADSRKWFFVQVKHLSHSRNHHHFHSVNLHQIFCLNSTSYFISNRCFYQTFVFRNHHLSYYATALCHLSFQPKSSLSASLLPIFGSIYRSFLSTFLLDFSCASYTSSKNCPSYLDACLSISLFKKLEEVLTISLIYSRNWLFRFSIQWVELGKTWDLIVFEVFSP